jgi:hypothetical protein
MEDRIVKNLKDINIYGELEKAGINHQRLVVGNLLGDFMELVSNWRSNPKKFKEKISKLREKALQPYLQDPDKFAEDIHLINQVYTHIVN